MNMRERNVFRVTLVEPYDGETEFHFTSRAAIYTIIPRESLGITCDSLTAAMARNGGWYANRKCTVRRYPLYGKGHDGKNR